MPVTANTDRTTPENRAFYPALDGIRAIAFLMVFFHHYYSLPWGWAGVNIFFVLSGFLITGILFDSRNDAHRARNFYLRRSLRIFPLYYGIFAVILLLDPVFHWRWSHAWFAWPLYLANFLPFVSSTVLVMGSPMRLAAYAWLSPSHGPQLTLFLGHLWSLCVEEQFYFFWPWIVFWVGSRRALTWICSLVVICVPLFRVFAQHAAPAWMLQVDLLNRATPFQLDALFLGGLVALQLRGPNRKRIFEIGTILMIYGTLLGVFVLIAGVSHSHSNWRAGFSYPSWKFTWGLTFINMFAAGIILTALQPRGPIYHILSLRPLRWLGRISYGAYVFHDIFHALYWNLVTAAGARFQFAANHAELAVLLLGLICTVTLSWLSFHFYESAFLNLKERWKTTPRREVV